MKDHWCEKFVKYYYRHIHDAIMHTGKFLRYNLYTSGTGITINAAESFNAVLKRFLDHREDRAQVLVLSLYQLDLYYRTEITRGFCTLRIFVLKKQLHHLKKDVMGVTYPTTHL